MILGKRSLILLGALLAAALVVSGVTLANRPDPVTLPEGTAVHVRLDNTVDSNQSRSGDEFDATVTEPVVVDRCWEENPHAQTEGERGFVGRSA